MWAVLDYTNTNCIERELLLAKVSILGPEYVEDQYLGGPTHEPRCPDDAKLNAEANLVQSFRSPLGDHHTADTLLVRPLTPA